MPRPHRIEYENAFYHIMNRGRERKTVFHSEAYYQAFLATLTEAAERFHAVIHAYCLMGNHYHLLLETPDANLSRIMQHIDGVYTQRYNRLKKTDGPQFRGRFKAINVDEDAYLLPLSRYIHRNPIETKRPLVQSLKNYPWSSYPAYIGKALSPAWLCRDRVYACLPVKNDCQRYTDYVDQGVDEDIQRFYGKNNLSTVLGDKVFRSQLVEYKESQSGVDVRPQLREKVASSVIVKTVANCCRVSEGSISDSQGKGGSANIPRKLAMYYCQRFGDMSLKAITQHFGLSHPGGVSSAIAHVKKELDKGELKEVMHQIENQLNSK